MRYLLLVVNLFVITTLFAQQRYISSGIIAFSGGAYERAIRDINLALENPGALSLDDASKSYFYRAASYIRLARKGASSDQGNVALFLSAYSDLKKVRSFGIPSWVERASKELYDIYPELKKQAELAYANSQNVSDSLARWALLSRSLNYLKAVTFIGPTWETNELMGKVYLGLATIAALEDQETGKRYYNDAIESFEASYKSNNECDCVEGLLEASRKIGDKERVERYAVVEN
ncbi:hypothetical protein [Marinoscillum sp. MHG1-6]|uniref:hypothetical protein n=1 Tax=Marinoscillum sp. MHG1-6 TaxID=2959627 RepID=UPI0021573077|nr:hypothetical protein [Marinoscillum sp. MHG1-6]